MRYLIPAAALAAMLLAACSESTTAPETSAPEHGTSSSSNPAPSFSATLPGSNVSVTSGSCSLISSVTGEVHCSYDVSNPDQLSINIYPEAQMAIDYQCVNATTGKIYSTGTGYRWTWIPFERVTEANPTGTDIKLGSATLPSGNSGKYHKSNACKAKQKLVITKYSLYHWDIWVDNYYDNQPSADYQWMCYAEDGMYGCTK